MAETFPDALAPLEEDLWLAPLRVALAEAVLLTGAASRAGVARSPVVTAVRGRPAADLGLLGVAPGRRSALAWLDPRPPARRLRAAWCTGRLRAALPGLATDIAGRADEELSSVGRPATLPDSRLLTVLRGSHQALVSLHAHEVLAGMLSGVPKAAPTAAGTALHVLAAARAEGLGDDEIVARHPVTLCLVPPAVGSAVRLPEVLVVPPPVPPHADPLSECREMLRLRVRWVHELTAVVAAELGSRLARRDLLPDARSVRWLHLEELEAAVVTGAVPDDLDRRGALAPAPPLPAAFRLAAGGAVLPVDLGGSGDGQGAGGGRAVGRAVHAGAGVPADGDVLVTRTLDPGLASVLPRLGGVVSETGSVLSHLAILARELGVPTVVGVRGALERFPAGTVLVVDGTAGVVAAVEETR